MSKTDVRSGMVERSKTTVVAGLQLLSGLLLRNRISRGLLERSRKPVTVWRQFLNDLVPGRCQSCKLLERSKQKGLLRFLNDRILGIILTLSLGDARARLEEMKKTVIRCIYESMGFQDIGLPNATMGLCCCKPPDDDETVAEQKPIKDGGPEGSYGTIKEKQISDGSAEKSSEKVPLEDESSTIGVIPDEATEATPLMESPDVVPKQPAEDDQSAPTDITEEVFKDTTEPTPEQPEATPQIEITPDTTQDTNQADEFASAGSSTPRASVDDPSTMSPSDEALQAEGEESPTKRKTSIGKKIKKKLGKLGGSKKTRSRKSTSSTGSKSQASSQTGSLGRQPGKQRSVSDTTEQ